MELPEGVTRRLGPRRSLRRQCQPVHQDRNPRSRSATRRRSHHHSDLVQRRRPTKPGARAKRCGAAFRSDHPTWTVCAIPPFSRFGKAIPACLNRRWSRPSIASMWVRRRAPTPRSLDRAWPSSDARVPEKRRTSRRNRRGILGLRWSARPSALRHVLMVLRDRVQHRRVVAEARLQISAGQDYSG
jgi:hypothetical protein